MGCHIHWPKSSSVFIGCTSSFQITFSSETSPPLRVPTNLHHWSKSKSPISFPLPFLFYDPVYVTGVFVQKCRVPMQNLIGHQGEKALSEIGFTEQLVSMGHQACGALELWNYPVWLRDLIPQDVDGRNRPDPVDLPSLESKSPSIFWGEWPTYDMRD